MSEKTAKTRRRKKELKKASVFLIVVAALLLLDGLAFAAWKLKDRSPAQEPPAPEATPAPTPVPAPTNEPAPAYTGGYMECPDGLFYPERTITLGELAEALGRAGNGAAELTGDPAEELTAPAFRAALAQLFGEDRADAAMGSTARRGGEAVTRAEAAVILNALLDPAPPAESGVFPDVEEGYWAAPAVALAGRSGRQWPGGGELPEPGFLLADGWLYYVGEDGYFLKNAFVGSLYFR